MSSPWRLQFFVAKDGIEGSFLGVQSMYADTSRIFLASGQGKLFVFDRNSNTNFQLLEVRQVSQQALTGVSGNPQCLIVSSVDGKLRVFDRKTLELIDTFPVSDYGLGGLACRGAEWYVTKGQGRIAVGRNQVFVSQQNEGDYAVKVGQNGTTLLEFGKTFEPGKTIVFDRKSGQKSGELANPQELKPAPSLETSAVALQVFHELLVQTTPGPWGQGTFVYQTTSLKIDQFIDWRGTNCAVIRKKPGSTLLIAGNEDGQIGLYDINSKPAPILDRVNLRVKTNNLNPEDIEVRALWADDADDFVFAASTWGNDQTRRPELPSFFVLKLVRQPDVLS